MNKGTSSIPTWIIVVTVLFALLEIGVSLSLWFSPSAFLEKVDINAKGVSYLVNMWAIRQLALGIVLAVAAFKRSAGMLNAAYIFLLVMFIGDLILGIMEKESSLIIAGLVMCIISAGMLYMINRNKTLRS